MTDEPMTDEQKLELLADWFDLQYPEDTNPEVQVDLRKIAASIQRLRKENGTLKEKLDRAIHELGEPKPGSEVALKEEIERLKKQAETTDQISRSKLRAALGPWG